MNNGAKCQQRQRVVQPIQGIGRGIEEKDVIEIMKKKLTADKFEIWKKKANAAKPKPKPIKIDDFDEELDGKYYIKNKFD